MAIAYIGLGSNLGDRVSCIMSAVAALQEKGASVLKQSTIIETDPVGGPPQNKFLNAVVKISTELSPLELFSVCQSIEKELGRVRGVVNGPRTIDLDILLYDRLTIDTPQLQIPHPRMFERAFVLEPLREIEPGLFYFAEYPAACRRDEGESRTLRSSNTKRSEVFERSRVGYSASKNEPSESF